MAESRHEQYSSGWLREQWQRGDRVLASERRAYWLNYSFFRGEQWVQWNTARREVVEFPRTDPSRARVTGNRIRPNVITLMAKMCKRELRFDVPAASADDGALAGARLGEHILEACRTENAWELVRVEAAFEAFLGATAAIAVEWDPQAGEELGIDEANGRVIGTGDVRLTALGIPEFTLEPGTRRFEDALWWMSARASPPEQVAEQFSLAELPDADASAHATPLQRKMWSDRTGGTNVDLTTVYTFYERPNRRNKKGRYCVLVGDNVVLDKPWPFPFDRLNLAVFRQQPLPKQWTGETMLNDARPLQVAYNHAISNLQEHMKKAGNARLAVPDTMLDQAENFTDEVAEIVWFDGMSNAKPGWIEPPHLDRWLVQRADAIREEIDDTMHVHDISRGKAPGDRNSGLALSVLAEKDEGPLGLMATDQSEGWSRVGTMVLELYAGKATEFRTAVVQTDSGIPIAREWTGRHLKGQTRARVPLESVMPQSRAAMQAWITSLAQQFPWMIPQNPAALARMLELPSAGAFGELADADVAQAERENHLMSIGEIPATSSGDVYPMAYDDHAKHIAEHNRFRKSRAYIEGDQKVREIVDLHLQAHQMLAAEEAAQQAQINQMSPGLAALPQANEPPGSMVPDDFAERSQEMAVATGGQMPPSAAPVP